MSDDDDECCQFRKRSVLNTAKKETLLFELERRIKARHAQLGGYLHDAQEHKLESRRFLLQGQELGARTEMRLSLESEAIYKREEAKYRNLVSLKNTLQEAKRNLTFAELLQGCTDEMQITLAQMPDVVELKERWVEQKEQVQYQEALLSPTVAMEEEERCELELPSPPSVTDQQVNEALTQLRSSSKAMTTTTMTAKVAVTTSEKYIVHQ